MYYHVVICLGRNTEGVTLVLQLAARRCHLVGEALHLREVVGDARCPFGRCGKSHARANDTRTELRGVQAFNGGLEFGRSLRHGHLGKDLLG